MNEVVTVTRKFQITIPKRVREKLRINVGDKLLVKVVDDKIVMVPIRGAVALKKLSTIADRLLGGSRKLNAVKLIEESLKEETGIT
ncbi:MAG TPA: AbrB/MazE/SpoVT family DNA-binding domain-containing protein [Thermoprotei archaeon]|nr:AbrB/MazE/SpoVT family DNA-binding domain-containing protein [Thermoprotei archaeon]